MQPSSMQRLKCFSIVINVLWWSGGTIHAYCTADRGLNLTGRIYVHFCFRLQDFFLLLIDEWPVWQRCYLDDGKGSGLQYGQSNVNVTHHYTPHYHIVCFVSLFRQRLLPGIWFCSLMYRTVHALFCTSGHRDPILSSYSTLLWELFERYWCLAHMFCKSAMAFGSSLLLLTRTDNMRPSTVESFLTDTSIAETPLHYAIYYTNSALSKETKIDINSTCVIIRTSLQYYGQFTWSQRNQNSCKHLLLIQPPLYYMNSSLAPRETKIHIISTSIIWTPLYYGQLTHSSLGPRKRPNSI